MRINIVHHCILNAILVCVLVCGREAEFRKVLMSVCNFRLNILFLGICWHSTILSWEFVTKGRPSGILNTLLGWHLGFVKVLIFKRCWVDSVVYSIATKRRCDGHVIGTPTFKITPGIRSICVVLTLSNSCCCSGWNQLDLSPMRFVDKLFLRGAKLTILWSELLLGCEKVCVGCPSSWKLLCLAWFGCSFHSLTVFCYSWFIPMIYSRESRLISSSS